MNALFVGSPDLTVLGRDGRNWLLVVEKEVVCNNGARYLMPAGSVSDGASIPQVCWSLGLAPFGVYWPAAFVHDCAYKGSLQVRSGLAWVDANLTRKEADELIDSLMFALGTPEVERKIIYDALRIAGEKAFEEDRKLLAAQAPAGVSGASEPTTRGGGSVSSLGEHSAAGSV